MKPLEMQVEFKSHLCLFNRIKELLQREGLLNEKAEDEEVRAAIDAWVHFVTQAQRRGWSQPLH